MLLNKEQKGKEATYHGRKRFRIRKRPRWWQENGLTVIPTVTWSDEDSFEYCFDGMPHESLVAVSSVGCEKSVYARENFFNGYQKMMEMLNPAQVIFYGNKPHWLEGAENVVFVAPAYKNRFGKGDE